MMWNPDLATQFVVANDDDQNPSFNVWDLRKTDYPVATFQNIHYSGITSISWCLADSNLVVSTGRDQRTVVTNFKTREMVLEFPNTESTYDSIIWSQHLNGKIAALDKDGNTDILSFQPASSQPIGETYQEQQPKEFAQPIESQQTNARYTPKWLLPKCGARFGFGGKLVTF